MASTRKLQGEIDRVLKQISEHMQEFDQIWQKVHSAPTPNLKEKYEGDLKKEIKKLQRFRDQLKSWATNNDIKNKKPLLDARKSIETEMERFKVLEKETKTKAYSKEGLNSSLRRARARASSSGSGAGDPREDPAKKDTFAWLDELEEALGTQVSELEEKLEGLKASSKKKKSAGLDAQVEELAAKIERHQFHLERLATIKDRLEHDELSVALVEDIHDDLDYYRNSNQEADFQEDETLYDALELDKEFTGGDEDEQDEDADDAQHDDDAQEDDAQEEDEEEEGEEEAGAEDDEAAADEEDAPGTVSAILKGAGAKTPTKGKQGQTVVAGGKAGAGKQATPASSPLSAAAVVKGRAGAAASAASAAAAAGPTPVVPAATVAAGKQDTLANILKSKQAAAAAAAAPAAAATPAASPSAAATVAAGDKRTPAGKAAAAAAPAASFSEADKRQSPPKTAAAAVSAAQSAGLGTQKTATPGVIPAIAPAQLGRLPPGTAAAKLQSGPGVMPPPGLSSQTPPPGLGLGTGLGGAGGSATDLSSLGGGAGAAPGVQNPPGVAHKERGPVPDEYLLQLQLLEPSLRHLPDPSDSDRPRSYQPRNPYRTPSYFPSLPAPIFEDPLLYEQLSVDTLFFVFYFQQGTPHQYLAARELKKQSWRYHKNFLTWFQRHDDPKLTTDDFEQGTYVYFDYDSGWTQRIKADFTFEYRHLEDELQVPVPNNL